MALEQEPNNPCTPSGTNPGVFGVWAAGLLIAGLTMLAYYPALRGEFVWDDVGWVGSGADELLADASGLVRMWCVPGAVQHYFPLTATTFWLDHQFWSTWTTPYHVENVLLHALSAVLFWRLLRRLDVPGAWVAGAIFALHPMMVESAAWITERKNVLSQALFLGALLQYGRFASFWGADDNPSPRRWIAWAFAFLLFLGAMLAKVSTFSLPACVLLICWWKRGRIRWKDDVLPVLPFVALAVALGLIAVSMERFSVGAEGAEWALTWPERLLVAGRALWFYLGMLFWPAGICSSYTRWRLDASAPGQWLYPVSFILLLAVLWLARRRIGRGPIAAFLFFAGTLFPVLGFMNVYGMRYSFVTDRWIYLPSLGIIALVVALATHFMNRHGKARLGRALVWVLLPLLAVLTWRQAGTFRSEFALWQNCIAHNPGSWMAHSNLGTVLLHRGNVDGALDHYRKSVEIRPDEPLTRVEIAIALQLKGRLDEAAGHYEAVLKAKPDYGQGHINYAILLMKMGRAGDAIAHINRALVLPMTAEQWQGLAALAWALGTSPDVSMRDGKVAVKLAQLADGFTKSRNPEVLQILAAAHAETGQFKEAAETARKALALARHEVLAGEIRVQLASYLKGEPFRNGERRAPPPQEPRVIR